MAADPRKVGRLVTIRTATGRLRPARITAVGAGTTVTAVVSTHGSAPESYTVGKWSRSTPATPGWIRT